MTDGGLNLLSRVDYIQERDIQYMGDGKRSPILTDIQSGLNCIRLFGMGRGEEERATAAGQGSVVSGYMTTRKDPDRAFSRWMRA